MLAGGLNLVIVAACLSLFSLASAQIKNNHNGILASKDVGNTLFSLYRSVLMNGNGSYLGEELFKQQLTNSRCFSDFFNLTNYEKLQYIDAAGKPNTGLLFGNNLWFGSVAECRNITNAHYCLSTLSIKLSANFTIPQVFWGACFPASCNASDIGILLRIFIFPMVKNSTNVGINLVGDICPPKPSYTTGVKVTLALSAFILLLCLIGTVIDLVIEAHDNCKTDIANSRFSIPNESVLNGGIPGPARASLEDHVQISDSAATLIPGHQVPPSRFPGSLYNMFHKLKGILCDVFLCFSLTRNTKKIFNTDVPSTAITSINGVRVISISWVILGHTYLFFIYSTFTEGKAQIVMDANMWSKMPVINGFYSVDSFFFLSGLLVAYTCMRKLQKSRGVFNWLLFYVHRFFRLTPTYMYVILFSMYLKRFLSDGPLYFQLFEDKQCEKYWWTNILYINNFHPKSLMDECIGWSWYLANDMQFFLIAPPLLVILYKFGWRALLLPAALLGLSSITIASIIGYYHLDPLLSLKIADQSPEDADKRLKYQDYIYIKPYGRIQPYLVGFILGYVMHMNFHRIQKPGWIVTLVGWIIAAITGVALVYGPHDSILPGAREWNEAEKILYGTFERLLWGLVLAWVTYACHYRAGGLVQKFLSAKFWIPLSRLTYSVYLIHLIVIPVMFFGGLGTIHYDTNTVSYYFISTVVLSYGAGFILSVCIEFPCDNLENLAIKYITSQRSFARW